MRRQIKLLMPDPLGLLERMTKNAPIRIVDPIREIRKSPLQAALEELEQFKTDCPLCKQDLDDAKNKIKRVLVVYEALNQVSDPNNTEELKKKLKELAEKYNLKLDEEKSEKK